MMPPLSMALRTGCARLKGDGEWLRFVCVGGPPCEGGEGGRGVI